MNSLIWQKESNSSTCPCLPRCLAAVQTHGFLKTTVILCQSPHLAILSVESGYSSDPQQLTSGLQVPPPPANLLMRSSPPFQCSAHLFLSCPGTCLFPFPAPSSILSLVALAILKLYTFSMIKMCGWQPMSSPVQYDPDRPRGKCFQKLV